MNDDVKEIIEGLDADQQHVMISAFKEKEIKHSGFSEEDKKIIFRDAHRDGSLKDAFIAHADTYGIKDIDTLFPSDSLTGAPALINKRVAWVDQIMSKVSKQPFSRVKSMFSDISKETMRAKGYVTASRKTEDVLGLIKRTTQPTTFYKKQKLDRDHITDIIDFDVVAWIKGIMRQKLDEELTRAVLFGDGRLNSDPNKIDETCIRPVYNDDDLFSVKVKIDSAVESSVAKEFITSCLTSRKLYRGSGSPDLYTTEELICEMLLLEDTTGRRIYRSVDELKSILRVNDIIAIEDMSGLVRAALDSETKTHKVLGIIVNMSDYTIGTDKGGQVAMFDDFDIDYNQQKYLIETRCSGALTIPYSALVIEDVVDITTGLSEIINNESVDTE